MFSPITVPYLQKLRWWSGAMAVSAMLTGLDAADGAESARVDPQVWADTAEDRSACFLVLLKDQADTAAVGRNPDRKDRGRALLASLRERADRTQGPICALLHAHGATNYRRYWIANLIAVEGRRRVVEALALRKDVLLVEPDPLVRVALEEPEGMQSDVGEEAASVPAATPGVAAGLAKIGAPSLWALGYTGQGIVYANADTGVQWDHPALKSQYRGWSGTNGNHDYHWWDAIHRDLSGNGTNPYGFNLPAPADDYGHGTHTMGIGVGGNGANQIGVAPGARWIACRNMEEGVGRPSTYIECLQFFLAPTDLAGNNPDPDLRPDVVGNSYTCTASELCSSISLQVAVENLRAAGVFLAVSAGNDGPGCGTVREPPALEAAAVTVGATDLSDFIASFSSRGPVLVDGSNRRKPDLVAPGVSVRSAYPIDGYRASSGTSMAAPHVAGAVALLWSAHPHLRRNVDYTQAILEQTAIPLTATPGCGGDGPTQIPNNVYGYGRLHVLGAYQAVNRPPVASNQVVTLEADATQLLVLTGQDPEGSVLTFRVTALPSHGLSTGFDLLSGRVAYTPAHGFVGDDGFTFAVDDGLFASSNATVSLTVTAPLDGDGDGMPDSWERTYGLDPGEAGDAAVDTDLDGMSNLEEYGVNTNPVDSNSLFRIVRVMREGAGRLLMTWESVGGTRYRVQVCEGVHLGAFPFVDIVRPAAEEIDPAVPGARSQMSFTEAPAQVPPLAPGRTRFFRIKAVH